MTPKFMTAKGAGLASGQSYYIGHVQHDRAMSKRETYEFLSERTGFRPAQLRAAFLASYLTKELRGSGPEKTSFSSNITSIYKSFSIFNAENRQQTFVT